MNERDDIGMANRARYSDPNEVDGYLGKRYHSLRIDISLEMMQSHMPPPAKMLEVGAATGSIARRFVRQGYDVVAADAEASVLPDQGECQRLTTACFDVRDRFPFEGQAFDALFAGEIVEHLFDPIAFLRECRRVLRPGGFLVVTTPNLAGLQDRIAFSWGASPRHIDPMHPYLKLHIRPFTASMLRQTLRACGFRPGPLRSNQVVLRIGERRWRSARLARIVPSLGGSLIMGSWAR